MGGGVTVIKRGTQNVFCRYWLLRPCHPALLGPSTVAASLQRSPGSEEQAVYGHIVEEETQNKFFFHSSAVVGRQPKLKDWVLFARAPLSDPSRCTHDLW